MLGPGQPPPVTYSCTRIAEGRADVDVIPVLDLMGGRVVQGLRGERQALPGRAQRARRRLRARGDRASAVPRVRRAGRVRRRPRRDRRQRATTSRPSVSCADRLGAEPWVDAGVSSEERRGAAPRRGSRARHRRHRDALRASVRCGRSARPCPPEQLLVSLDVGERGVLSRCPALSGRAPMQALEVLAAEGVTRRHPARAGQRRYRRRAGCRARCGPCGRRSRSCA